MNTKGNVTYWLVVLVIVISIGNSLFIFKVYSSVTATASIAMDLDSSILSTSEEIKGSDEENMSNTRKLMLRHDTFLRKVAFRVDSIQVDQTKKLNNSNTRIRELKSSMDRNFDELTNKDEQIANRISNIDLKIDSLSIKLYKVSAETRQIMPMYDSLSMQSRRIGNLQQSIISSQVNQVNTQNELNTIKTTFEEFRNDLNRRLNTNQEEVSNQLTQINELLIELQKSVDAFEIQSDTSSSK